MTAHSDSPSSRQRPVVSIAWMYVVSLLGTSFLCIVAVIVITIMRPTVDNTAMVTIIIGFGITQFTALTAAIKAQEAKHVSRENAYRLDGRMEELMKFLAEAKKLEGLVEGAGIKNGGALPPAPSNAPPKE